MKTSITKKFSFSSGHRLYNPRLSDEQNRDIFGPCANEGGHGHNYILEVTLTGEIDLQTGMIINLKQMKQIIEEKIIRLVDHKNLNSEVDFMKDTIPTTENFARKIWVILDKSFGGESLDKLVLRETENNRVEVSRSGGDLS